MLPRSRVLALCYPVAASRLSVRPVERAVNKAGSEKDQSYYGR
jgi:hypothetical protein